MGHTKNQETHTRTSLRNPPTMQARANTALTPIWAPHVHPHQILSPRTFFKFSAGYKMNSV